MKSSSNYELYAWIWFSHWGFPTSHHFPATPSRLWNSTNSVGNGMTTTPTTKLDKLAVVALIEATSRPISDARVGY
jgi:hypothetical protein